MKPGIDFAGRFRGLAVICLVLLLTPHLLADHFLTVELTVPGSLGLGQVYEANLRVKTQVPVADGYAKLSLPYAFRVISGRTSYRGAFDPASELVLSVRFEVTATQDGTIMGRALAYFGEPRSVIGNGQILYCRAADRAVLISDKSPEAEEEIRWLAKQAAPVQAEQAAGRDPLERMMDERRIFRGLAAGPRYRGALVSAQAIPENADLPVLIEEARERRYTFTGHRGDRVWITATSDELDPRLLLLRSDGTLVAEDDDGAGMLNARIPAQAVLELPSDDAYTIVIFEHQGAAGNARLKLENFTHLQTPVAPAPAAGKAEDAGLAGAQAADASLTGKIIYNSADGSVSAVRFAVVRLFSSGLLWDTEIGSARTDASGNVTLTVPQANRGDTLFIRVYTTDAGLGIASVQDPLLGLGLYHNAKRDNFTLPASTNVTFGTWNVAETGENGPFLLFDAAVEGYLISTQVLGFTPPGVTVNFPIRQWSLFPELVPNDYDAHYCSGIIQMLGCPPATGNGQIYLHELFYNSPDTVLHEYGHFVADNAKFLDRRAGGDHQFPFTAHIDPIMAWNEGWATFFAVGGQNARRKPGKTWYYSNHATRPFYYDLENGHSPASISDAAAGDDNEGSVQFALWDLYDSGQDVLPVARSVDTVSLGLKTIFDVARNGAVLVVGGSRVLYAVAYLEMFYDGLFQQRSFGSDQIAAIQGVFRDQYIRWEVPPAPPVGLKFGWKGSAIALQWQPGSPNSVAYVINQKLPGQAEFKLLGSSGSAEYVLGSVVVGATFQVTAYSDYTARFRALLPSGPSQQITYSAPPPTITCTYTLSSTAWYAPAGGGTGSVSVNTTAGCSWTAVSGVSWITITSGASGTGSGSVTYSVAANTSVSGRTGTLTIAGLTFTVTQAGTALCSYSIAPTSASVPASGGPGSIAVTTTANCSWTASSNVNWITVSSGASGTGNGAVSYTVAANTSTSLRTGTLTIAGLTFTVTQAGVSGTPVQLTAAPPTLAFTYQIGGAAPPAQTVSLTATGGAALSLNASVTTSTGGSWLWRTAATSATTPATLYIAVSPAVLSTLAAGDYWGALVITAPGATNSPVVVGITLTVSQSLPKVTITSVVNGASFKPGFASSGWVTIMGTNLSRTTRIWKPEEIVGGQLPTSLDGVRATINGRPAFVYYISPAQLNVQAPTDEDHDWVEANVEVEVIAPDGSAKTTAAWKRRFAPGVFMFDPDGRRYVAAVHADGTLVGRENLIPGAASRPAGPGDVIMLFMTGMGWATDPAIPAGQVVTAPAVLLNRVEVLVGGKAAEVSYAGLVGAGLYQINLTVPEVPDGDQAVMVQIAGVPSQDGAFMTIRR